MRYKVIIHGNDIYKEVPLPEDFSGSLLLGTEKNCHVVFNEESFDYRFIARIDREDTGNFIISCSENVYLKGSQGLKEFVRYLAVGDYVDLCYGTNNKAFFRVEFLIEYESVGSDYDFVIDCRNVKDIIIGSERNCTIRIDNPILGSEAVKLSPTGDGGYRVDLSSATYGVMINGMMPREKAVNIRNGEFVSIMGYSFCFEDGFVYTSKNANIITACPAHKIQNQKNHFEYPKFELNTRQKYKIPSDEIEVLDPEGKQEEDEQNFLMTVMPMLVNMIVMVGMRGMMGGNAMFALYFGVTMAISTTVTIINFVTNKKKKREKESKRHETYMKYLGKKEDEIIKLREREKVVANVMNPELTEYVDFAMDFNNRLFEKTKGDDDYLKIRMGSGIVPAACQVKYTPDEYVNITDDLKDYPKAIHDKYQFMDDMPVLLELNDVNAVGFIGVRSKLYQMTKNIMVEFATSHFYKDIKLFLLMDEEDVTLFDWARWFQITYNNHTGARNFSYDQESAKISLEFLYSELSRRESVAKDIKELGLEDYIVLVYKSKLISDHPVSKYISRAKELGFRFVFFEEFEEKLNQECQSRIFLADKDNSGYIQDANDGEKIQQFTYQHITKEKAAEVALRIAPVYVDEVNLENSLTKNITLFELLKISSPYDLDLNRRWSTSRIYESMAAPLGVKSGDEIVCLDLHEKYHGPHGLVAGTTGSGKSEILQSYILSMATLFHPYEVGFVIIDFKGGGMVNQFRNLPHLNGAITNIDGNEVERSLLSIKAELVKRQELFAEQNVNHIDDYIRAYKDGKAKTPLPHLILIVDEFAELKAEQPEFMKELISAARIGRSLGIHLILATQKPAGVVSDQIWSNSKFKLCLKVQNKNDSNEVLKSPLAAEITEPGRAYLQVGNNEIFQLFQSAYSGAPAKTYGITEQKKFNILKVDLSGKRSIIYEQKPKKTEGGDSQLKAIVNYINEYCTNAGIERLPNICMPSLPEAIPYTEEGFKNDSTDIIVPVGLTDNPSKQEQYLETFNISQNNYYIIGSSQSGKTNLLQTIIRGLTSLYSPKDVNIFILDLASMILKNFETLNHVGSVITSNDEERLKGLFKILSQTIAERKNKLAKLGLSSYSSYREAGYKDMPQIVVILDNWTGFRSYFADYEDAFIQLSRESVSVGISLIVTTANATSAGFKLLANFAKRSALYCNDSSDYSTIFESCRMKIPAVSGRAIIEKEKTFYECQYYLSFAAEKEFEKIKLMKEYIAEINKKYEGIAAKGIPEIPQNVTEAFMFKQFTKEMFEPYKIPLGMEFTTIDKRGLDLERAQYFAFVGGNETGRKSYMKYFMKRLADIKAKYPMNIHMIDDDEQEYKASESLFTTYTKGMVGLDKVIREVNDKLVERVAKIKANTLDLKNEPLELIIINSQDMIKTLGTDKELAEMYRNFTSIYKNLKVCFIYPNLENNLIGFTAGEALKNLKETKRILSFEDLKNLRAIDVPLMQAREFKKPIEGAEAYLFNGDKIEKLRTVL